MCGCSVDCCAFLYDSPCTTLSLYVYEVLFSLDVFSVCVLDTRVQPALLWLSPAVVISL